MRATLFVCTDPPGTYENHGTLTFDVEGLSWPGFAGMLLAGAQSMNRDNTEPDKRVEIKIEGDDKALRKALGA